MKKYIIPFLLLTFLISEFSEAQVRVYVGPGTRYRRYQRPNNQKQKRPQQNLPKFEPTVNLSVGYGFPNLDKDMLPSFYNYYRGNVDQTGPITGALDYQFSRSMSIGVLVTHGEVKAPYYNYNGNPTPVLNGSLDNWAFMLNLVRYMPVMSDKVTPYIRTAIGINSWKQDFTDASGNKVFFDTPSELAYQVGLGAKFNLSKKAGIFVEAGYGKYILHGGLSLKF